MIDIRRLNDDISGSKRTSSIYVGRDNDNCEKGILISGALKGIVEKYGSTILGDSNRINAFLMDYIPKHPKERKLIVSVLNEGVGEVLIKAAEGDCNNKSLAVERCVKRLVSEMWLSQEAVLFAVNIVAKALGYDVTFETGLCKSHNSSEDSKGVLTLKELIKGDYTGKGEPGRFLADGDYSIIGYKALASLDEVEVIEVPENIKLIRSKAFFNCFKLKSIKLPLEIEALGSNVFDGCYNLQNIVSGGNYCVINNMLIDRKNKRLMRAGNCGKVKAEIPKGIKVIDERAFDKNPLSEVIISASVDEIKTNAFYDCKNLQKFVVKQGNRSYCGIDGVLYSYDFKTLLKYPIGKAEYSYYLEDKVELIAERAFSEACGLVSITFNSNIRTIGKAAFEYCCSLETVVLPGSIWEIGERAFQYCSKLKNVILSKNINEIGDFAFCNCEELKSINVPQNVERIGNSAFFECKQLKSIVIQERVRHIGERAFIGCSDLLKISVKDNKYVENYCRSHGIEYCLI